MRWIIDGAEVKRITKTGNIYKNPNPPPIPGRVGWSGYAAPGVNEFFAGYIDDVKIYANALD